MSRLVDMTGWKMWEHGFPSSTIEVIERYPKTDSSRNTFWKCKCHCPKEHGDYLIIRGDHLRNGDTRGCGNTISKGEEKISKILKENNINFVKQKSFPDCIYPDSNRYGFFDFYVENKYLIEYDGELHYTYKDNGWNTAKLFERTKLHDKIKNDYCRNNHIPLIRIPYTHYNNLSLKDLILEDTEFLI